MQDDRDDKQDHLNLDREGGPPANQILDLMAALRDSLRERCTCGGASQDWENHAVECLWRQQMERRSSNAAENIPQNIPDDGPPRDRKARFDEALARLDAEVAEHEAEIRIGNETDEPVQYRVLGPGIATLPDDGRRFGDRLREWRAGDSDTRRLLAIADAIDQDRDELRGWVRDEVIKRVEEVEEERRAVILAELKGTVRRQVEGAVERLRYTVEHHDGVTVDPADILDAEPLLAELDRIFGERAEEESERQKVGRELLAWYRDDTGEEAFPTAIERICGVRQEAAGAEDRDCAGHCVRCGGPVYQRPGKPGEYDHDHEPAHDRRERESARNEDSRGRVEGVDR